MKHISKKLLYVVLFSSFNNASANVLDVSFSVVLGSDRPNVSSMVQQGEKLIASISQVEDVDGDPAQDGFGLVRLNEDFTLDTTFNSDAAGVQLEPGIQLTIFPGLVARSRDIAIQDDGKYVVSGVGGTNMLTARYNTDGELDTTFSPAGTPAGTITNLIGNIDAPSFFSTLAIQKKGENKGKIVQAAHGTSKFPMTRYNTDGSTDTSFGPNGDGEVFTTISSFNGVYDMILQPNDKIIIAAAGVTNVLAQPAILRFNANGTLDTSFGTTGIIIQDIPGPITHGIFRTAFVLAGGKILAVGASGIVGSGICLVQYLSDGTLDDQFGTGGIALVPANTSFAAEAAAIQPDGKVLIGGKTVDNTSFALFRSNTDGTLDTSFGTNGVLTVTQRVRSLIQLTSGKFVYGCNFSSGPAACALRYTNLDPFEPVEPHLINPFTEDDPELVVARSLFGKWARVFVDDTFPT